LRELLSLALTHIEETNSHREPIVNCLHDPGEAERHTIQLELRFHTPVNAGRKAVAGADAAPAHAEVENAGRDPGAHIDEEDTCLRVHHVTRCGAPLAHRLAGWFRVA